MELTSLIIITFFISGILWKTAADILSENKLKQFLATDYEKQASEMCYKVNKAEYDFETDVTNKTKEKITTDIAIDIAKWSRGIWQLYFKDASLENIKDPLLKRQISSLKILGHSMLERDNLKKYSDVTNKMTEIHTTAKVCPYEKQNCNLTVEGLELEPDIAEVLSKSSNYDELLYFWKSWRDVTGAKIKDLYRVYVDLANEAARLNNFNDNGEVWRSAYEDKDFIQHVDQMWLEVQPLYLELHKYVSKKLKLKYGDKLDISDGLVPAHVFGNMWAQEWNYLADLVKPFPNAMGFDTDVALKTKGYKIEDMFKRADEFYQSLGLMPCGFSYNESAGVMIRKPTDGREVVCHASAWDFCDGKTYRLKMCTVANFDNFITIHHEMGHIQYFLQYKNQSYTFREGANPGFHEAIGDTIALSVTSLKHLKTIGLIDERTTDSQERKINCLMEVALDKVAFLPFGLIIDKWRWDVFNKSVSPEKWNSHWWDYRKRYQGIKPPIQRNDSLDFDPGAKFHVAGDSPYIAYFIAHILQFQLYKSLCIAAKEYNPLNKNVYLHDCDFFKSKDAGNILKSGLSLGSSKHWSEVLDIMTGNSQLSVQALLEYFRPLYEFLKNENKR